MPGVRDDVVANTIPYLTSLEVRPYGTSEKIKFNRYDRENMQSMYRITQYQDALGNQINWQYDSSERVTRVTDASGLRYAEFHYKPNVSTPVVESIDLVFPGGIKTWRFLTDGQGMLKEISFPGHISVAKFSYDGDRLNSITDLNGYEWAYTYDNSNRVARASLVDDDRDPTTYTMGYSFVYEDGSTEFKTTFTDLEGRKVRHVYAEDVNDWPFNKAIARIENLNSLGAVFSQEKYSWNSDGTVKTHTDRNGKVTYLYWDGGRRGLLKKKVDRLGAETIYDYDSKGRLASVIDPMGLKTAYTYLGNTTLKTQEVIDPSVSPGDGRLNLERKWTYTSTGEVATEVQGNLPAVTYTDFDSYGNCRSVIDTYGYPTIFEYDHLNRKISEKLPSPRGIVNYTYDDADRLKKVVNPDLTYIEMTYDQMGKKLSQRDENGFVTSFEYDNRDQLSVIVTPVSSSQSILVQKWYDSAGRVTKARDGRNNLTQYQYNLAGDLERVTYPDLSYKSYGYDLNGNLTSIEDGIGQSTFTYDNEGRVLTYQHYDGKSGSYTYRLDGLISSRSENNSLGLQTYTFTYDNAKRLLTSYQPTPNLQVAYTYDENSRRKTLTVGAMTWTYYYQPGGRLSYITQTIGRGQPIALSYNPDGSTATHTYGNYDQVLRNNYDARGRLTSLSYRSYPAGYSGPFPNIAAEIEVQKMSYEYDAANNVARYMNTSVGGNSWSTLYSYDRTNRLTNELRQGGSVANFEHSYGYDANGNRIAFSRNGVQVGSYTFDNNNKLISGTDGFAVGQYNAAGSPLNLTWPGKGLFTFTYDSNQRPLTTQVVLGGVGASWSYVYDADGRRVRSTRNGSARSYVYDAETIVAEVDETGQLVSFHLNDVGWIAKEGGVWVQRFYRQNALGSNLSVLDMAGAKVSESEFDAYGNEYTVQPGPESQFGFAGKHGYQTDANGLMLLGVRYYIAPLGRFLTQDPLGHEPGLNLYQYASNNPLSRLDPEGTWDWAQYWSDVGGVFKGYGQAIWGTVRAPVTAAEFLGNWAGSDWSGDYAKSAFSQAWGHFASGITGERGAVGFGDSFGSVLIAAGTAGAGFAEGGAFSRVSFVTRWDTVEGLNAIKTSGYLRQGAFVQRGKGNYLQYMLSGVAQQGYKYGSKMTIRVPKSYLKFPSGWEWIKGTFGQRQLRGNFKF